MSDEFEPRIALLEEHDAMRAASDAGLPEGLATLSVFRVLLRHPGVARALNGMLRTLLFEGTLDHRLRELVIMRIGWLTSSDYEWTQHWRVATGLGIDQADLLACRDGPSSARFGVAERAVLEATDETLGTGTISDATWTACERALSSETALIELVTAIGNWRLFSSVLRSLRVPLEQGVASWPPDGRAPHGHAGEDS